MNDFDAVRDNDDLADRLANDPAYADWSDELDRQTMVEIQMNDANAEAGCAFCLANSDAGYPVPPMDYPF